MFRVYSQQDKHNGQRLDLHVISDEDYFIGKKNTSNVLYLHYAAYNNVLEDIKESSNLDKDVNVVIKTSVHAAWERAGEFIMDKFDVDAVIFGVSPRVLNLDWVGFAIDFPSNSNMEVFK